MKNYCFFQWTLFEVSEFEPFVFSRAFTMGYGHPPDENFSLMILMIMGFCLGLPAVIIVLSGLYVALRRITYRKDDLLLNS